jgi:hypothetical protein
VGNRGDHSASSPSESGPVCDRDKSGRYGILGGIVAVIFPYRGRPTEGKALLLGCGFPATAAFMRPTGAGHPLGEADVQAPWTAWDFVALF